MHSAVNVNYVTKSGGNDFHGNAVYYWTGRAMDANDWINKAEGFDRPFNNANQWAASIGGPIKKDKLFFYRQHGRFARFNSGAVRRDEFPTRHLSRPQLPILPSGAGKLDSLLLPEPGGNMPGSGSDSRLRPGHLQSLQRDSGLRFGSADCVQPIAASDRAGVGNPIPSTLTNCTNSLQEIPINFAPEWQIAGRWDWNVGVNDRAFVRIQYDHGVQPSVTDPINPLFNITSDQPEWQTQINETHTFSPTLVNQLIVAGTWYSAIFKSPDQAAALAAFPGTLELGDGSLTNIGGAIGFVFPQGRNVTQFQVGDDVSKTLGNHTVKFGFKFHRNWVSDHDGGFFTSPLQIPLSLTDFFNGGTGAEQIQAFSNVQNIPIRINNLGFYVQDEWRVKPNFTLTLAMRLEHNSNPYCVTDCFSTFAGGYDQAVASVGDPYNTLIQTGRSQALYN